MNQRARLSALWAGAMFLLVACGGGGGDTPTPAPPAGGPPPAPAPSPPATSPSGVTLSGSISTADTAAVDSDTNDVNQADYRVNDTPSQAQPLGSPVLLVGTVNQPQTGPSGTNYAAGDVDDGFRVTLAAGQVVELDFASDPAATDIDLYLHSADGGTIVGRSDRSDTRFECIAVNTAGTYLVRVTAFRNASIYNLRIGAPGTAGTCANGTLSASFDPRHLLAAPKSHGDAVRAHALERRAGVRKLAQTIGAGPQLLHLPASQGERAQGLAALAGNAGGIQPGRGVPATQARGGAADVWPAALDTLQYAKRLRASGAYRYVEPNYVVERKALTGTFPPDDRGYSYQRWHYEQINLPSAMARIAALNPQPTQRPLAAVVDDGIVIDHPDLAPQLFSSGRAFITINTAGDGNQASADDPSTAADTPSFHGTHVAGTVGAATFDGNGGAGVAPMAQIMPLRVFAPGSRSNTLDIVNAMLYAARLPNNSATLPQRPADVINLSLGAAGNCPPALQDAIDQVRAAGVIVVVAAGNNASNDQGRRAPVSWPANCNGAVAVSATENHKAITSYSNTGAQITVAAPGGDTSQSTTGNGAPDGVYSAVGSFDAAGTRRASFGAKEGTSMAAPHVAGVMALMRYVNPALTPAQVDTLFSQGRLSDDLGSAGHDIDFGFGLIDARKAVDEALAAAGGAPPAPPAGQIIAMPASIDFGSFQSTATLELKANGATGEQVVSISADSAAVTLTPTADVDGATGLGTYSVAVDRNALTGSGSFFPTLTVTLSSSRTFSVPLSIRKGDAGQAGGGDFGPLYVLLIDPDTNQVVDTVLATRSGGRYTWSAAGYTRSRVAVVAGGDLDNDDVICQRGEPCGGYPVLEPTGNLMPIELNGDRTDLDFRAAPLSGISAQARGALEPGWRRTQRAKSH